MNKIIEVEIWSDIMCPFCYIGKRNFENALHKLNVKESVSVVWKSYQLSPNLVTDPNLSLNEMLAKHKNISLEQASAMNNQVQAFANTVGLDYRLDCAIPANTFNAHRLIHFSKTLKKQDQMKERLLKAYFMDGKNIDDLDTLAELAVEIGLKEDEVKQVLMSNRYTGEVRRDFYEAQQIGVTGVPFFVFNNKKAISGAQPPEVFVQLLEALL